MARLNDTTVRRTKPGRNDKWLADGNGLYLRITPGGARSWWFRQTRKGHRIQDRLGTLDDLTLAEARLKAATRAVGKNSSKTVSDLAEAWFDDCVAPFSRRPHHIRGYLDRAIIAELGDRPLRKVDRSDVVEMLEAYKKRGTVATNQLRVVARQMFGYGVEKGWIEAAPTDGITKRICGAAATPGDRVLSDDEILHVWHFDSRHRRLCRLLLLTGLRIGEMQTARWEHVVDQTLSIPEAHSKNKKSHWVHLPKLALAELGERGEPGDLILPHVTPTAVQAWMRRYCNSQGFEPAFTPHDLRRTFATRLNDELKVEPWIVEKMLNHKLVGVMAVYNHAEHTQQRVEAAEIWAAEVERLLGGEAA